VAAYIDAAINNRDPAGDAFAGGAIPFLGLSKRGHNLGTSCDRLSGYSGHRFHLADDLGGKWEDRLYDVFQKVRVRTPIRIVSLLIAWFIFYFSLEVLARGKFEAAASADLNFRLLMFFVLFIFVLYALTGQGAFRTSVWNLAKGMLFFIGPVAFLYMSFLVGVFPLSSATAWLPHWATPHASTAWLLDNRQNPNWPFRHHLVLKDRLLIKVPPPDGIITAYVRNKKLNRENALLDHAEGLNLSGRTLRRPNFFNSRFYAADLRGADLRGVNLQWADFRRPTFSDRINLDRIARFQGADLKGAQLQAAQLHNVNFNGPNLDYLVLIGTHKFD